MVAIARALYRSFPVTKTEVESLEIVALFCLVVSLMVASYGLDLSPGFF
jgi:hypothetical protein